MDKQERKKTLVAQYKAYLPPMGVFKITNKATGRFALGVSANLKGTLNSLRFQLESGNCLKFPAVQKDWQAYGAAHFAFETVEELAYDEAEPERDYSDDLALLLEMTLDKLSAEERARLY